MATDQRTTKANTVASNSLNLATGTYRDKTHAMPYRIPVHSPDIGLSCRLCGARLVGSSRIHGARAPVHGYSDTIQLHWLTSLRTERLYNLFMARSRHGHAFAVHPQVARKTCEWEMRGRRGSTSSTYTVNSYMYASHTCI